MNGNDYATQHHGMPAMAVVMSNTLAIMGMKQMLTAVMRGLQIAVFYRFSDFEKAGPEHFVHFFVDFSIVLENMPFFSQNRRKTIVLTPSAEADRQISGFHSICINQSEEGLVKSVLMLVQQGHPHGHPPVPSGMANGTPRLSEREGEVLALVAQGFINKEIADRLNIALTTVITHRKNITEKLGIKSVSALTIYAVLNGYVDINRI